MPFVGKNCAVGLSFVSSYQELPVSVARSAWGIQVNKAMAAFTANSKM